MLAGKEKLTHEIANPGDTIFMLSGVYPNLLITRPISIRKWNTDAGVVTIPQP